MKAIGGKRSAASYRLAAGDWPGYAGVITSSSSQAPMWVSRFRFEGTGLSNAVCRDIS